MGTQMTDVLVFLFAMLGSLIGYGIGFYQGWQFGRRWGEADGWAAATERLRQFSQRCK